MRNSLALAVVFSLMSAPNGWTVGHYPPGLYPHARQDQIHQPSADEIRAHGGSIKAAIIGSASGPKTVAVIIVQFPSASSTWTSPPGSCAPGSGTQNLIQNLSFIDSYFTKMNQYYLEVSQNAITSITFKFFGSNTNTLNGSASAVAAGAYTLPQPMEYYGCGDEGMGCANVPTPSFPSVGANGDYLIRDAISAARAGQALNGFSNSPAASNSGGIFDAVVVMHAGNGNETTGGGASTGCGNPNGDIWSIFYSQDSVITSAGGGFTEGDVVPETEARGIVSPLGVMCHEFGHELGLPDLYNTTVSGGSSVVGFWELMDEGPFDGNGANPSHMGAWDKLHLGWITPEVVSTRGSSTLGYVENTKSLLQLPVQNGTGQEYFLVEYRSQSSGAQFDQKIPGTGLLIWHVDDAITSARGIAATDPSLQNTVNSGNPHYGVSIVPADGIAISSNLGDSGNPYTNGSIFISPSSNNFAGQPSGVSLLNITGVGSPTAAFSVANFAVSAGQSILKVINYPNPAGKGYNSYPSPNHTTLQFQLSRPANDYSINIYTLSGDLVRKIGKNDITLNINRSDNDKWVYEFDWDLTNGGGAMVAPGVYLYLVRADGQSHTAKAVIIR